MVVFGGDKEITTTDVDADYRVAGVISTDPRLKLIHQRVMIKHTHT